MKVHLWILLISIVRSLIQSFENFYDKCEGLVEFNVGDTVFTLKFGVRKEWFVFLTGWVGRAVCPSNFRGRIGKVVSCLGRSNMRRCKCKGF